jgi:anaerobic magnesium-protoporphyrin IX monomethyl ester cyclase
MIEPAEVVKHLQGLRGQKVFFYDDNFFISKRRGKELLRQMIRADLGIRFFAQIRIDSVCKNGEIDRELLDLLWNAGCRIVYLGLESINPETLKEYHKESSVEDMQGGLAALAERGIKTHGMFVFGADSDTVDSLLKTADFAVKYGLNSVQFLALTPLPGTRQTAQFEAEGRIFTKNWSLYDGHHVVFWPKRMTPYELQEVLLQAHKRFYSIAQMINPWPKTPVYHKHRLQGYIMARAWEHVRENRDFLRELKDYCDSHVRPRAIAREFDRHGLETVTE